MPANKFRIEGLRETERALGDLPRATAKGVTRRVLRKAGAPIKDDAEANAPSLTGRLRADVKLGSRLNRRQAAMNRKLGPSAVEIHIGVSDPAGVQTEFGNQNQAAEPWLRPAWDANKMGALAYISAQLWVETKKSADRLARKAARG